MSWNGKWEILSSMNILYEKLLCFRCQNSDTINNVSYLSRLFIQRFPFTLTRIFPRITHLCSEELLVDQEQRRGDSESVCDIWSPLPVSQSQRHRCWETLQMNSSPARNRRNCCSQSAQTWRIR